MTFLNHYSFNTIFHSDKYVNNIPVIKVFLFFFCNIKIPKTIVSTNIPTHITPKAFYHNCQAIIIYKTLSSDNIHSTDIKSEQTIFMPARYSNMKWTSALRKHDHALYKMCIKLWSTNMLARIHIETAINLASEIRSLFGSGIFVFVWWL